MSSLVLFLQVLAQIMGTNKVKQRDVVNQKASNATLSVNERILKECHQLYMDPDNGLVEVHIDRIYLESQI